MTGHNYVILFYRTSGIHRACLLKKKSWETQLLPLSNSALVYKNKAF